MKTIYERMVDAGVRTEHHESDLYVPVTPLTTALVKQYEHKGNVELFIAHDDSRWFDIPFGYDPFWKERVEA